MNTMAEKETNFGIWMFGILTAVIFVLTFIFGWITAHSTIAGECNKLGAFYVGDKVYECKVKQ